MYYFLPSILLTYCGPRGSGGHTFIAEQLRTTTFLKNETRPSLTLGPIRPRVIVFRVTVRVTVRVRFIVHHSHSDLLGLGLAFLGLGLRLGLGTRTC